MPAGYIRATETGGRRLFQADPGCSVFREVQSIVLKLRGAVSAIRQVLTESSGVELAWIFGSFAAGTATASSDVDLMLLGRADVRRLRSALSRVERSLGRTVNEHVISPREWTTRLRRDGFLQEVRRSAKLWVVGEEDQLRALESGSKR